MKHYIPEVKTVEGEDDPNSDVKPIMNTINGRSRPTIIWWTN